jgi:hypothetical protein
MSENTQTTIERSSPPTNANDGSDPSNLLDKRSASPSPPHDSSSSEIMSSTEPSKEEAVRLLEEEIKHDYELGGYHKRFLLGMIELYKAFLLLKAAEDTIKESGLNIYMDALHNHLSEAAWSLEVEMKSEAKKFLGSQNCKCPG